VIQLALRNQKGWKLKGTNQFLVYGDDVNFFSKNTKVHTIKKNAEAASNEHQLYDQQPCHANELLQFQMWQNCNLIKYAIFTGKNTIQSVSPYRL
jgi:hypothetical protein